MAEPRGRSAAAVAARKQRMIARLRLAAGGWVRAADLAHAAAVTPRSIRTYVAAINRDTDDFTIESTSLGYRLLLPADVALPALQQDDRAKRERVLLRTLVRADDGIDVFETADALHVSESTLESDLTRLRRGLAADNVGIERDGPRLRLVGEPAAVHRVVAGIVRSEVGGGLDVVSVLEDVFPHRDVRGFAEDLDRALAHEGREINDYGFANALLHIVVALDHAPHLDGATAAPTAVDEVIQRHFGTALDADASAQLWRMLDARALSDVAGEREREAAALLATIRDRLDDEHGARLEDAASLDRFRLHLANLLRRIDDGAFNENPWTDAMRSDYPMVFELAVTAAHEIQRATGRALPEAEVGFLAFHLGASLHEQAVWEAPLTVAVQSPRYHEVATTIAERIAVDLGPAVTVTVVTSKPSVAAASGADVVVATEPIAAVDVVIVTPLFGASDALAVRRAVETQRARRRARRVRENLLRCFDRNAFVGLLEASDAVDAIRQLGSVLVGDGAIEAADIERMLEREAMASTAFLEGLAMPHAFGMHAKRTVFAVAISETPIPWGDRFVQVIVMLAVARSDRDVFREAMDELTKLLLEPGAVAALQRSRDYDAFLAALGGLLDR